MVSTTFLPNSNQFTHDYHLCGNAAILQILEFQPRKMPKYRGFKGTQSHSKGFKGTTAFLYNILWQNRGRNIKNRKRANLVEKTVEISGRSQLYDFTGVS